MTIENQREQIREILHNYLGIEPRAEWVEQWVQPDRPDATFGPTNGPRFARWIDPVELVQEAQAQADPLTVIYREVLGREPDLEGLAYWRGVYQDGLPLSEVIRHIENSPEARG